MFDFLKEIKEKNEKEEKEYLSRRQPYYQKVICPTQKGYRKGCFGNKPWSIINPKNEKEK